MRKLDGPEYSRLLNEYRRECGDSAAIKAGAALSWGQRRAFERWVERRYGA